MRHGQTQFNLSGLKVDHEDVSLNEFGIKQAEKIEPIIASLPIKSVCYSPFKRAIETKDIISARLMANHYQMESLGECSSLVWNNMTRLGSDAPFKAAEDVKIFFQRTLNGLNEALSLDGTPLLVAHGGIHWAICSLMMIKGHEWEIGNCLPVHFFLDETQMWRAKKLQI